MERFADEPLLARRASEAPGEECVEDDILEDADFEAAW